MMPLALGLAKEKGAYAGLMVTMEVERRPLGIDSPNSTLNSEYPPQTYDAKNCDMRLCDHILILNVGSTVTFGKLALE